MRRNGSGGHRRDMAGSISSLQSYSDALAGAVAASGRSVAAVHARQRIPSSGVHWRAGVIVTADHTLKREDEITVTLPDGRDVDAELAGRDPGTDLAVLRVTGESATAAYFADPGALQPGNLVFAIGRRGQNGLSASMGVISAVSGAWRTWRGGSVDQFVRPDVNLYPGMSGGPLVDTQGAVLGINTSGLTRGVGVTIPVATVNRVCDELLQRGKVARGYLGVGLHQVELPGSGAGLIVLSVEPNGPAAKSGVFVGDVVLEIDGEKVRDTDDVQSHLAGESVGKPLSVALIRGGARVELRVVPGER
jgi:S1-C subfamily serine protease